MVVNGVTIPRNGRKKNSNWDYLTPTSGVITLPDTKGRCWGDHPFQFGKDHFQGRFCILGRVSLSMEGHPSARGFNI